jgi:cytochrome c
MALCAALAPARLAAQQVTIPLPPACKAQLADLRIAPELPRDVEGGLRQANLNVVQRAADLFSWQEFMALNWPAKEGERGEPDRARKIGEPGSRVGETWKETYEVYNAEGSDPGEWNAPERLPEACRKLLRRTQKVDDEVDATLQAVGARADPPPTLTDQRGRLVRYEIRMNRVLFDFIRQYPLYNSDVQQKSNGVSFPDGSILIKASWREIDPADEARFLAVEACVADRVDAQLQKPRARRMGLAGFHIMHKTLNARQWVWSTFEHVDNVRSATGAAPSFHDPACVDCVVNQQTPRGVPNQVTRVIPIPAADPDCAQEKKSVDNVEKLNATVRAALAEWRTPLQYYELINTQWPLPGPEGAPREAATVFAAVPALLGNTTMETFAQGTSSCMGCHAMARTTRTDRFAGSDFSFTLNNANPPAKPDPRLIAAPSHPRTDWDRTNWNSVLRGHALAARTYELLPEFTTAKLHCGSCHLGNGGNPDAAWWVGMIAKYQYPSTTALPARINSCFEHSLNGKPLCPPEHAGDNPAMMAFIKYMQWLDEQYQGHSGPVPNGYPTIDFKAGDEGRGAGIFLQKCAFCHGRDGQGRYAGGPYFRPALWGAHSFNASAGMATPATFAAFIKSNMPLGSGGVLTDREACDLAAFVDQQPRPGK